MRRMKIQFYTNFQILFSINFNVKREREKYGYTVNPRRNYSLFENAFFKT